jgi:hypothetical protein
MSAQVAVYVLSKYAKPAYTVENYNVRAWPGLEMICHVPQQPRLFSSVRLIAGLWRAGQPAGE